jgi:hypothetical protein
LKTDINFAGGKRSKYKIMEEKDKLNGKIKLPDGRTIQVLQLPGGRIIDFPFLMNASVDAIVVNEDAITIAYLFIEPQEIALENIICPRSMGYLRGEILTKAISKVIEGDTCSICNIHLDEPIEIVTIFLGIFRVQTLGVDANCNLVTFVRTDK